MAHILIVLLGVLALGCGAGEAQSSSAASTDRLPGIAAAFPQGLEGQLVFQSDVQGPTRLFTLDLRTRTIARVGSAGAWADEEPEWSPDGSRIAFSSTRAGDGNFDVYVMNADGGGVTRLTDHAAPEQDPTWAADGQSVFFTAERDGRGEIYRVWLADKRVERVTNSIDRAIMPAASPDGKHLAYAAQTIMNFQLHLIDLTTGARRQITQGGGACRPAWAPDSREIAFVRIAKEPSQIEAVQESGPRVLLADRALWSYYPDYSPDGKTIALSVSPEHHDGEDWDLALMDPARPGAFVRLTEGPGNDRVPDWRPRRP